MSTPNMTLVLPVDHASSDQWDVILDAVFNLIDSHDHSTGKGVKVPASALNINADVSWSSGGVSRSITDLIAVDFQPGPASGVTGLAGALFLNNADNELYWRTTSGTNVKMTAGAALNVAAFTGGIGGDYAATGALVVFDDSTDSYWFQQQVGASVRQYARMRCGDVDLYEYKANPTASVPTNRVRLASPAALAASYALTLPAALPVSSQPLYVSSSGIVAAAQPVFTMQIPPNWGTGTATWNGIANNGTTVPVPLNNGDRIVAVRVRLQDSATGPTKYTVSLKSVVDGTASTVATSAQSSGAGTNQTLTIGSLTTIIASGTNYELVLAQATGSTNGIVFWYEVDYDHP